MTTIIYKCGCTHGAEREIVVTPRVEGSDIGDWMDNVVTPSVSYDHRHRSRWCNRSKLDYIKIKMEEGFEIGTEPTRN